MMRAMLSAWALVGALAIVSFFAASGTKSAPQLLAHMIPQGDIGLASSSTTRSTPTPTDTYCLDHQVTSSSTAMGPTANAGFLANIEISALDTNNGDSLRVKREARLELVSPNTQANRMNREENRVDKASCKAPVCRFANARAFTAPMIPLRV